MSLRIHQTGRFGDWVYWRAAGALAGIRQNTANSFAPAGPAWLVPQLSQRIAAALPNIANDAAYTAVLDRWIWPWRWRSLRWAVSQATSVRLYPDFVEAAAGLVGEAEAEPLLQVERQLAANLDADAGFVNRLAGHAQAVEAYALANNPAVANGNAFVGPVLQRGRRTEYLWGTTFRNPYRTALNAGGVRQVLSLVANQNPPDLGGIVAALHDASVLVKRAAGVPGTNLHGFQAFDDDALRVTCLDLGPPPVVQVQQVGQIPDPLNIGHPMRWTLAGGPGVDQRTPNERHPAIQDARFKRYPLQMGPSRTTAHYLNLARNAGLNAAALADLTLALVTFWHRDYSQACSMIHCFHFATDAAINNFGVARNDLQAAMGVANTNLVYGGNPHF